MSGPSGSGLSLEQGPPILVPFRFFLAAPWFGVLAAIVLFFQDSSTLENRWSPALLAVTHLMTLGFLGLIMLGAMMQMLPVVAGIPVVRAPLVAAGTILLLVPGILSLAGGLFFQKQWPTALAMALLGAGLVVFIFAAGRSLIRATVNPTVLTMRLAILGLTITAGLGLTLASNHAAGWWLVQRVAITNLHASWGFLGWIIMLIIGVAYQVVPMFQLTSPYPRIMTGWLTPALFVLMAIHSLLWSSFEEAGAIIPFLILFGIGSFVGVTLFLQMRRRRRYFDEALWFWRIGLMSLLAGIFLLIISFAKGLPFIASIQADRFIEREDWLLGILFMVGFATSIVSGMLYKIVPFLVWFHLQSELTVPVPHMKLILPDGRVRIHLVLHCLALACLIITTRWPILLQPSALLLGISMSILGGNIGMALHMYRKCARSGANP